MAVTTSQAFVDDLEKSKILASDQLAKARQQAGDESDPKKIARRLIQSGILTRWQATELINGRCDLTRGKYKLLERLGEKKTSEVYLAEHSQMARRVAIRMLKKSDKGFNDFVKEARSIASFDHRNIVHVYDIDSDGENYYLVMENIQGKDLQLRVETDGKMDFPQVAECMRQASAGLAHAHQRGVVHRNICPSNMILDDKGSLKIINMGVARLSDEHDINEQADLFSLGCTCYFLLAGHPPFGEEKYSEHKLGENPPSPRGIQHERPDVPKDLLAICRKMMAKNRDERFQSAKQVEAVFEKWLAKNHGSNGAGANDAKQTAPAPKKPAAKPAPRSKTAAKAPPARAAKAGNGAATPKSKKTPTAAAKQASKPASSGEPAPGDFAFADSKKRTQTTKAAAATPTPAASSAQAASPAANNVAPKKKLPMGLILGGVAAGLLVLAGFAVAGYMLFGRGDDQQDVADASANPAATATANPGDEPANPEPSNPEPVNPEPVDPPTDPTTDPNDEEEVAKVDPADKPVDPTTDPTDPTTDPADPTTDPADPTTDPGNTTPPPTDPDPKKPPVEEPKAEPVTNPFLKLPATLALPATAPAEGQSSQPAVLGNLGKIDPRTTIFVRLDGAGGAIKGDKYMFEIESARGGLAKRDWEIFVSPSANEAGDEPGPQIASLQIKDDKLLFNWTEAGTTDPNAAYLQNCILQMSFGDFVSNTALRKPLMSEPIELDFSIGNRVTLDALEKLPAVEKLRLELSLVGVPKHNFAQVATFNPAPKGGTYASIGDGEALFVDVKTTFGRKGALAFVVSPMAKLGEGNAFSLRGKTKEFDKPNAPNPYEFQLQQLRQGLANLEAQKGKAKNKKPFDAPINRAKGMITNMQSMSESYKHLLTAYKAAKAGEGKLHYRLYFLASGQEIDLAMSRPRQVKKPAKKPPAKK